jgi:two-component system phosphate regulon sensor histidine kinase PhoR
MPAVGLGSDATRDGAIMSEESERRLHPGVFFRALLVSVLATAIAGASAAIGLTSMGWAAPLLLIVVGVWLIYALLHRAERRRVSQLRSLTDRALRIGSPEVGGEPGPATESAWAQLDRRAAEVEERFAALRQEAEAARDVLSAIDEPVIATDESGRITLCNRASEALLAGEAVAGRRLDDLLAQPELLKLHRSALAGTAKRARVRLVQEGATKWFDVSSSPIRSGEGVRGATLCLRDVTELATAVQLKTDFAANASHELRTPIASIRAATETMARGGDEDPAMRQRLRSMIESNVSRLEELVSDLLDLSRLETPELDTRRERVVLMELFESIRPTYDGVCAERELRLETDFGAGASSVEGDPKLLELILRNLIDNASKFAFEGTPIVIRSRRVEGGAIELGVIDRGVGIPLADQQRIFERFYQVDQARKGGSPRRGTGLGLAIVKHAARRLGGSVRVESVWQEGTSMFVRLPQPSPAEGENSGAERAR